MTMRPYNNYADYFKQLFGGRVQKISVDAGFSCPNRDGSKGTGGCTFCDNEAFNPSYCQPAKGITQQIAEGIEFHHRRYRRAKQFLVYFQAYSNTYKPLAELQKLYEEALSHPAVVGLVIGTRPDTVDETILQYLKQLQHKAYIMLEYGVESVYDETLMRVNRGHSFAEAKSAINSTYEAGIPCGGHFVFGLPGESRQMMLESAEIISELPLTTVKFHQLQIFKGTPMAGEYLSRREDFQLFSLEEYIDFIVEFTANLRPDFIIERFAGEVPPRFLVSPAWDRIRYDVVLQRIEKCFEEKGLYQGKFWKQK